jgi:catechol 2,3-dioxygenase-like lactoylglutathione lyase family enzyme
MTSPTTTSVPVLAVAELLRSVAWYERLGFSTVATYDRYAVLVLDGAEVHLSVMEQVSSPQAATGGAYLRVGDADAVFARWTAMGAPILAPPTDQPYGVREFATEDLDGNLWRVGHFLDAPESGDEPAQGDDLPRTAAVPDDPRPEPDGDGGAGAPRRYGGPGTPLEAWVPLVASAAPCAGCGLTQGELPVRALGAQIRDEVHAFGRLLTAADDDAVRARPTPDAWSALEYGAHVRDVLAVFAERVVRTLAEHEPELGWWDHEAAIADGMANESLVDAVVDDLGRNAAKLSESLRLVGDEDWERAATRRSGERFTVELLARFALHEVVHHRADARAAIDAAAALDGGRLS